MNWRGYTHDSYGLCLDGANNVWNTSATGGQIRKFSPSGDLLATASYGGSAAQGCVIDQSGDVWVALSVGGVGVAHLDSLGRYRGTITTPSGPTGVAVDAKGKVWSTNFSAGTVSRIDPSKGIADPYGGRVGAVDLTTPYLGGQLYNYSDMTGSTLVGAPKDGTWTFVHDGGAAGAEWGTLTWRSLLPGDSSIDVKVATSEDGKSFGVPVVVKNGVDVAIANGRYLQVTVSFHRSSKGESPHLYELVIATAGTKVDMAANTAPSVEAGPDVVATWPNPIRVTGSVRDDGLPIGKTSMVWSKVSGPGTMTFGTGDRERTDVTVSEPGTYVLRLTASDSSLSASDDLVMTVLVANQAPTITAATPLSTAFGSAASLTASITDDGLPTGSTVVSTWSKVSGPGAVTFADASKSNTSATFAVAGAYVLAISATDGHLSASKQVAVEVTGGSGSDAGVTDSGVTDLGVTDSGVTDSGATDSGVTDSGFAAPNAAPVVVAPASRTFALPTRTVSLSGSVSDDGLPAGGALTTTWSQVSGPGTVTFSSTTTALTTVTVPNLAGVYVLRLTGSDGLLSSTMDVTLTVLDAAKLNEAPSVAVGAALTVDVGASVKLSGVVTDDGLPVGGTLQSQWIAVSGPATPTFGDERSPTSTVIFPAAGDYTLRLYAFDGDLMNSALLLVRANDVVVNKAPVATASAPAVAPLPGFVTLAGSVTDDALPVSGTLTSSWSKVSGPGTVTFGSPTSPTTTASFAAAGKYVLRLSASDGALTGSFDVTVSAEPKNAPPVVSAGLAQTLVYPKNTVALTGNVTDDGLPSGVLTSEWTTVSGPAIAKVAEPANPKSYVTFPMPGVYVLRLSATDGRDAASGDVTMTVGAPSGVTPVVSFASPADGSRLTKPTPIVGSVSGGEWRLELAQGDEDSATLGAFRTLGSGSTAVSAGTLATLDTSTMLNGSYTLRLTSSTSAGTATATMGVVLDKQLKVGVFALAFDDLTVPANGFSLQVQRAYDNRDKSVGDFGIGWRLGVRGVRLEKTANLGKYWYQWKDDSGFFTQYCVRPQRAGQVSVTLPSGKVYRFESKLTPECQTLYPVDIADVTFQPMAGTVGSLSATDGTGVHVVQATGLPGPARLETLSFEVWNPTKFTLSDEDGIQYVLDQRSGIEQIKDLDGNTLTVGPTGLKHSSGQEVKYTRDAQGRITAVTDPSGKVLRYTYDALGNLATFTNREGETQGYAYDGAHDLVSMTDARGIKPATYGYDSAGRLTGVSDALGGSTKFVHDVDGRKETITDALGNVTVYEYDDAGNVLKKTDALGKLTSYTYDPNDNKLSETDALGQTQSWSYDARNNLASETDALGNVTKYTWGNNRRMTSRSDALGRKTSDVWDFFWNQRLSHLDGAGAETKYHHESGFLGTLDTTWDPRSAQSRSWRAADGLASWEEDAFGRQVSSTYDKAGNRLTEMRKRTKSDGTLETVVTSWTYDSEGRVLKSTSPDGSSTSSTYDKLGKVLSSTDALGRVTRHEYDTLGRQTKTIHPDGTSESTTYDVLGRRASSTDAAGRVTTYGYDKVGRLVETKYPDGTTSSSTYDDAGRLTRSTNELGHVTTYGYDAAGRRTSVTDALGNVTTMTYDAAGQLSSVTDPLGHVTRYSYDLAGRQTKTTYHDGTVEETTYDAVGNRVSKKDQAGVVTTYAYDLLGRLTSVTDALGGVTTYGYDELGQKVAQTDALSHTTRYAYDSLGRRVSRTLPLGQTEKSVYDVAGNVTAKVDFNGKTTSFEYDSSGRLVKRTPDAAFAEPSVTWTYSSTGRRLTMTDATGTTTYGYDARDRLLSKATPYGTLTYTRDAAGHVKSVRSDKTDGVAVDYGYDDDERLAKVTDASILKATSYSYDKAGRILGWVQPNGVATNFTYDDVNHLKNVSITDTKLSTLASYAYTLSPTGNRTGVTEKSGRTLAWTYDTLYRLKSETITGSASANGSIAYSYDAVGNRLSRTSTVTGVPSTSTAFDANDRTVGDTWNDNGNMLTREGRAQSFDSLDRLVSSAAAAGPAVKVSYDGDGNRVAQEVGGVVTTYLVDDQNPTGYAQVVEERVAGAVNKSYVFGEKAISQRVKLSGGTWATLFFEHDGHGSVVALTDSVGTVTDTWEYDAFGTVVARTGTNENSLLYSGEWTDKEQGLQYLRARWYAPGAGRFLSGDTYEGTPHNPQSLHRFLYVSGNPLLRIDPTGHAEFNLTSLFNNMRIQATLYATSLSVSTVKVIDIAKQAAISVEQQLVAEAEQMAAFIRSDLWKRAPFERGFEIEELLGTNLPRSFPTFDRFTNGIATSIKSMNLFSPTYWDMGNVTRVVTGYLDKASTFSSRVFDGARVGTTDAPIVLRRLELAIPVVTHAELDVVLAELAAYGRSLKEPVELVIVRLP